MGRQPMRYEDQAEGGCARQMVAYLGHCRGVVELSFSTYLTHLSI